MIPANYAEWRYCIIEQCKVDLNLDYITGRLQILSNEKIEETHLFRKKYGDMHWRHIISWFEQAKQELHS